MGKANPQQPTAPDPTTVDNAQTAANEQTAQYQQQLNMINTQGPNGSVNYTPSGAPGGYTQTTTLSPAQQGIYNSETSAEQGALNIGNNQLGNVQNALNQTLTPGQLNYGATGGPIQTSVSGAAQGDQAVQNAANAAYGTATQYLTPQLQQQQEQLQSQLTAQGLNPNDTAYQNAQTLFNNQSNQAYQGAANAAVTAGDQEQNTLYGQALNSGQFANQAQSQGYQENYNNAGLNNQAQSQDFQQQAYQQSLPINELSSLLGLGQVSTPTGVNYSPTQVGQTNVDNAYALNSQVNQSNYQNQLQQQNSLMNGLFSLGSAAMLA